MYLCSEDSERGSALILRKLRRRSSHGREEEIDEEEEEEEEEGSLPKQKETHKSLSSFFLLCVSPLLSLFLRFSFRDHLSTSASQRWEEELSSEAWLA